MTNKIPEDKFKITKEQLQELVDNGFIEKRPGYLQNNKKKINKYYCQDCLTNFPDFYMVHNTIWKEAGFKSPSDGICCLYCLQKRLKRNLVITDFNDAPVNDCIRFGYEMARKTLNKNINKNIKEIISKWMET